MYFFHLNDNNLIVQFNYVPILNCFIIYLFKNPVSIRTICAFIVEQCGFQWMPDGLFVYVQI